jgi:hypothetical protein
MGFSAAGPIPPGTPAGIARNMTARSTRRRTSSRSGTKAETHPHAAMRELHPLTMARRSRCSERSGARLLAPQCRHPNRQGAVEAVRVAAVLLRVTEVRAGDASQQAGGRPLPARHADLPVLRTSRPEASRLAAAGMPVSDCLATAASDEKHHHESSGGAPGSGDAGTLVRHGSGPHARAGGRGTGRRGSPGR